MKHLVNTNLTEIGNFDFKELYSPETKGLILDYVNGKIDRIEELDEALLPFRGKEESTRMVYAPFYSTVNILHHDSVAL